MSVCPKEASPSLVCDEHEQNNRLGGDTTTFSCSHDRLQTFCKRSQVLLAPVLSALTTTEMTTSDAPNDSKIRNMIPLHTCQNQQGSYWTQLLVLLSRLEIHKSGQRPLWIGRDQFDPIHERNPVSESATALLPSLHACAHVCVRTHLGILTWRNFLLNKGL